MATTMKKTLKKYERPILLAVVVILLATFSVTGAVQCGSQTAGGSFEMGGSFNVTPSEREEVSDRDFDAVLARSQSFSRAMLMPTGATLPSWEFSQQLFARAPGNPFEEAWMQHISLSAARAAGYLAGDHQVRKGIEDLVGFSLRFRAQLPYSDVNYQNFLRQNYDRSEADFQESVRDVVVRDQFLYPLVTSSRYVTTYPQAYEKWKSSRERVDLEYVSMGVAPFAAEVRLAETTRALIGEQATLFDQVSRTAVQIRRVSAQLEAAKKKDGAYPDALPATVRPDQWGTELRYEKKDDEAAVISAGADKEFGTPDDVTLDTQKQFDTRRALNDVASQLRARHKADDAWPAALTDLVEPGGDERVPTTTLAKDGWSQELVYEAGEAPTLASIGPDGAAGTADDVVVRLEADKVTVPLGPGLEAHRMADATDGWGKAFDITLKRGAPPAWNIVSAGPDGELGTDDDVSTDNRRELLSFFKAHEADYVRPLRRRFETLFLHLPLVSDAVLRKLWAQYPQHHPKSEKEVYDEWHSYKGKEFFYGADEPADPKEGHGAELAMRVAPDSRHYLVPAKDVFPESLDPESDDDQPKDDQPKDDQPKDDEPKDDDAGVESIDEENRRIYREKGWREIVLRQIFLESLLNDLGKRCRESGAARAKAQAAHEKWKEQHAAWEVAHAAWTKDNEDKPAADRTPEPQEPQEPEIPAELTFAGVMRTELAEALAAGGSDDAPAIQHWTTPELMTRKEWESNENFGKGLQFALDGLKEDGQYYGIPVPLHRRNSKVLLRRLEMQPEAQQTLEDVRDEVFTRFAEWRQMDRAAKELGKLRKAYEAAVAELPEDADEAARAAAWQQVLADWGKENDGRYRVESTGLFIGSKSPPSIEVADGTPPEAAAEIERRNFIWRAGYGTVEGTGEDSDAAPSTLGRSVLRDHVIKDRDPEIVDGKPQPNDTGTGTAYLVRVKQRVFPTKQEFSPRRYVDWLHEDVFGDMASLRSRKSLKEMPGRINKALSHWFSDFDWVRRTFDLETNSPLEEKKRDKKKR